MSTTLRIALLCAGALSLCACAILQGHAPAGAPDEAAWQAHRTELAALDSWTLSGRVGFINGKDSGSGSLDWQQQGGVLTFDFHGPLGAGAVHIQGDSKALWVKTSSGDDFVTDAPEDDFAARLRMPLPVLSMRYWMMGLPVPLRSLSRRAARIAMSSCSGMSAGPSARRMRPSSRTSKSRLSP